MLGSIQFFQHPINGIPTVIPALVNTENEDGTFNLTLFTSEGTVQVNTVPPEQVLMQGEEPAQVAASAADPDDELISGDDTLSGDESVNGTTEDDGVNGDEGDEDDVDSTFTPKPKPTPAKPTPGHAQQRGTPVQQKGKAKGR